MSPTDAQGNARSLYFDSDCIQELDLKWHLTKKVVNVVSSNFYFLKPENLILRPLKNCNKQNDGRWKKAYQAVKHDRVGSLNAGNIGNLIKAMAALYLLNIYNMDEKVRDIEIGTTEIDTNLGSAVFSVNVFKATMLEMGEHMDDSSILQRQNSTPERTIDATVLIDKYTEESFRKLHKNYVADMKVTQKNIEESEEIKAFLADHPDYSDKSLNEICIACGEEKERKKLGITGDSISIGNKEIIKHAGQRMLMSIISFTNTKQGKPAKRELIINKLQPIYPSL